MARRAGYYLAERACAMPGDEHSEGTGAGVGEKRARSEVSIDIGDGHGGGGKKANNKIKG